ncbi:MAG TPA: phosphatase PAP2 family protein [Gemmatimonadaceae bacterium]|nr:phosphatase PAP2 family protein [Gemmatimonadaceae bacterium]
MRSSSNRRSGTLRRVAWIALLGTQASTAFAQIDATSHPPPLFTWRDGVLAGGFVVATILTRPIDKRAAVSLQDSLRQKNSIYQKSAAIVRNIALPGSTIIGPTMYAAGRLAHNDKLAQVGLYGTEALVVGALTGTLLKDTFGRARPFVDTTGPNPDDWQLLRGFHGGESYRSFPSGHSTAAFAAAAAVSAETSRWWPELTYFGIGPILYGGAAAVGLSRMYNNRHWASDVITGAMIGTFAGTKMVRYNRVHPDNRLNRWLLKTEVSIRPSHGASFSIYPALAR